MFLTARMFLSGSYICPFANSLLILENKEGTCSGLMRKAHQKLASHCLELMSKPSGLQQDMCGLVRPGALRSDIDEETIASNLPPELRYACRYWVHHLEQSQQQLNNGDLVHPFLQKHLLYWLEAMSLIKETNKCVRLLERLQLLTNVRSLKTFFCQYYTYLQCSHPQILSQAFFATRNDLCYDFNVLVDAPTDLFFGACFCARDEHYPADFRRPSSGVD